MKKICAFAVIGLMPVAASAESVGFGTLNIHYEAVDTNGQRDYQLNDRGTRLGFRGARYLNENLEASFILEAETGIADEDKLVHETRQAWLGVRGNFGELRFGKHLSPTLVAIDPVDLFGDQIADLSTVLEGERHHRRSLAYINLFNNIGYAVAVADNNKNNHLSADILVNYDNDVVYLAGAYLNGADDKDVLRLAASYRFPGGHRLGAAYEHLEDDKGNNSHDAYALNGAYQVGRSLLKAQVGWNNPEAVGETETMLGLGVDYQWSKPLTFKLQYSENQHRDHSDGDRERAITLGLAYQF